MTIIKQTLSRFLFVPVTFSGVLLGSLTDQPDTAPASLVEVQRGSAAFGVTTNVPGIEVKGKSSMLSASVAVQRNGDGLFLQEVRASLPVKSLTTGMKVRDEHMRKLIFMSADGQEQDLQFTADRVSCVKGEGAKQFDCDVSGSLTLRSISRPFAMKIQVKEEAGSTPEFRAVGTGILKLNDYGIETPSQFGVKTSNDVKLRLEFTGREKSRVASSRSGIL